MNVDDGGVSAVDGAVTARGRMPMPLISSLAAAASKAAVGLATAALLVAGGSVAAAAATTHSANPATWGRTVTDAVASCKGQLGDGQHGIGQCVSAVARKHGQDQRAAHSQAGGDEAQPAGGPSPHPTGTDRADRGSSANAHAGGRLAGVPAGPPTSVPPAAGGSHPSGPPVAPPTPTPRHQ
jgi:hypothetical protein